MSVQPDTIAAGVRVVLLKDMKQGQSQPTCDAVGAGCNTEEGWVDVVSHDTTASSYGSDVQMSVQPTLWQQG